MRRLPGRHAAAGPRRAAGRTRARAGGAGSSPPGRPARRGRPCPPRPRRGRASPVRSFVTDAQRSSTSPARDVRRPRRRARHLRPPCARPSRRSFARRPRRVILGAWSAGSSHRARRSRSAGATAGRSSPVRTSASREPRRSCRATPIRPPTPYEQMRRCLEIVERALARGGSEPRGRRAHARLHDRRRARSRGDARARRGVRVDRPACTGVVCGLLDERWLVELEVEAVVA